MARKNIGTRAEPEWVDPADPYYWQQGVTKFAPEQAQQQFNETQNVWRDQMRDNPGLANPYPSFLLDKSTQWNDPRVTPWLGIDPNTGVYQGMQQQPYSTDPNTGFGGFLKAAAPFFLGAGGALGGLSSFGIPGIPGLNPAASAGLGHMPATEVAAALSGAGTGATAAGASAYPSAVSNYAAPANTYGGASSANLFSPTASLDEMIAGLTSGGELNTAGLGTAAQQTGLAGSLGASAAELGGGLGLTTALGTGGPMGAATGLPSWLTNLGPTALAPLVNRDVGTPGGPTNNNGSTNIPSIGGNGSNASAVSELLKKLGLDVNPSTLGLLGALGSTALGVYGANQQSNAADEQTALARDIFNYEKGNRQPSLDYYNNLLQNPESFYGSPQAKGAVDASLRGLSAQVGNPINNPSALASSAAYNLGGYTNALNSAAGNAGIGNAQTIGGLGNVYGNSILGQGQAAGGVPNALGYGLSSLLNNRPNYYLQG